eukprot:scaffold13015_cov76-Phaeocystis_antarctica.AAC.1
MVKGGGMGGFEGGQLEHPRQWLGAQCMGPASFGSAELPRAARRALRRHSSRAGALPQGTTLTMLQRGLGFSLTLTRRGTTQGEAPFEGISQSLCCPASLCTSSKEAVARSEQEGLSRSLPPSVPPPPRSAGQAACRRAQRKPDTPTQVNDTARIPERPHGPQDGDYAAGALGAWLRPP